MPDILTAPEESIIVQSQSIERLALDSLRPYPNNARRHSDANIAKIARSIQAYGFTTPILVTDSLEVIAGHGRLFAAQKLGLEDVPCIRLSHLTPQLVSAYRLADNRLALDSDWDEELLAEAIAQLKEDPDFDTGLTGFEPDEIDDFDDHESNGEAATRTLAERFGVPPFSVLNAREGWWQTRKQAWIALGIKSELGRLSNLLDMSASVAGITDQAERDEWNQKRRKGALEKGTSSVLDPEYARENYGKNGAQCGTSIFDPVLSELLYRWFCPPTGRVLDPFAGGSVRGVVAARLGREYTGIDLSGAQIAANRAQWADIGGGPEPEWRQGNSELAGEILGPAFKADFILSCPPYADLEKYSDHADDISNKPYPEFLEHYKAIIRECVAFLRDDSFVAWVVGEVRDKNGNYYGFVADTIKAFNDAGLALYNEAILVTAIGTLPVRVSSWFMSARKLGKTHQNVLVFLKGNAKRASEKVGACEFGDIPDDTTNQEN